MDNNQYEIISKLIDINATFDSIDKHLVLISSDISTITWWVIIVSVCFLVEIVFFKEKKVEKIDVEFGDMKPAEPMFYRVIKHETNEKIIINSNDILKIEQTDDNRARITIKKGADFEVIELKDTFKNFQKSMQGN